MIVKCPSTVRGTFSSVVAHLLRLLWCRTCLSVVRGMVWHLPVFSFSGQPAPTTRDGKHVPVVVDSLFFNAQGIV
jgi:hypothetical protein